MPALVVSTFKLENDHGFAVPSIDYGYLEKETGVQWTVNCGGTRAYFIRFGDNLEMDFDIQSADSHFMAQRTTTALFLSGAGLYRAKSVGRTIVDGVPYEKINVTTHLDLWKNDIINQNKEEDERIKNEFIDWYQFISSNTLFKRAADDLYYALDNPLEAYFYLYRSMEWIMKASKIGIKEFANDIGVKENEVKKFKRQANADHGQRHGIPSGRKLRINFEAISSMTCDFLFALFKARNRVDSSYLVPPMEKAALPILKAVSFVSYP